MSGNRSNFIDYGGIILWYYTYTQKLPPLYVFEDKRCYKESPHFVDTLLTPYPTLMPPLQKISRESSIKATARNPKIDLQSIGIYSR